MSGQVRRLIDGSLRESWMSDLQIATRAAKIDRIRATRRFRPRRGQALRADGPDPSAARDPPMIPSWWTCSSLGCGTPKRYDLENALLAWSRPIPYSGAHSSGGLMGGARGCLRRGIWRVIPRRYL